MRYMVMMSVLKMNDNQCSERQTFDLVTGGLFEAADTLEQQVHLGLIRFLISQCFLRHPVKSWKG